MPGDPTRLQIFVDAGLLPGLPTRRQLRQAELEMTPYVLSTDATSEDGYRDHVLSHPVVRQALIFPHVGRDHVRTGAALGARLESLCAHLIVTFHRGMPVFDLQLVQTHPDGLARLRAAIDDTLSRASRRRWQIASLLLRDPAAYLARFLGPDGYIARAARFDYPGPASEDSAFPPEFFSLVRLATHALTFPDERISPRRALHLLSRRFREGGQLGWLGDRTRG